MGVVEDCCAQALSGGRSVSVFLRDVSAIDAAGRGLLYRLAGLGVQLMASVVYMSISSRTCSAAGKPRDPLALHGGDHA